MPAALRLLDTPPAHGAWNMALDLALMEAVRAGAAPALRFYRWAPACLSFGRNQPARGRYDGAAIERAGLDVVRRPTGGRAVLHDRELTYAAVAPSAWLGGPRAVYAAVNRALVLGLRRLGVAAELQPRRGSRAPSPSLDPCFHEPVEGEVVVGGRKLVGSAQVCEAGVILQHGSLLLDTDQSAIPGLLRQPPERPAAPAPALTLADLVERIPGWPELTAALAAGWAAESGCELRAARPSRQELRRADELVSRFGDPAWTWRC